MALTVQEFSAKIKAKYPDYASMDDTELAQRIVAKHPEYADSVSFEPVTPESTLVQKGIARGKAAVSAGAQAVERGVGTVKSALGGIPEELRDVTPTVGVEEEPTLFGGGSAGAPSGATGTFEAPVLEPMAPARALGVERGVETTPPLEKGTEGRAPLPNVPAVATLYGAAKSLPFVGSLLPEGEDVQTIEETNPGSVMLGYFGGMAAQTVALGGAISALPKVKNLQAAAALIKNPTVQKAAQMGIQATVRGLAGGTTSGLQNAQQVADGKATIGEALLNTAETSLASAASVLPEGILPKGYPINCTACGRCLV